MSFNIKNRFTSGIVNSDDAHEYIQPTELISAENVDVFNRNKNSNGNVSSILGNIQIGGVLANGDYYVGHTTWKENIYLFYTTDTENYVREYNSLSGSFSTVVINDLNMPLKTDSGYDNFVLSADVVDGVFLYWSGGIRQSNGDLIGYKEPLRLHIEDAKANPSTYSDFTGNLDKPTKLNVVSKYDGTIVNNLLKYNSFIFYKRYINKYNEKTVLSYPSDCVDVSLGSNSGVLNNSIDIASFSVDSSVVGVDILMSNDSTNTLYVVKSIDTTVNKTVSGFTFKNSFEYPVLDANTSDIINYRFPLTATEEEIVDNRIVYGDVEMDYEFVDENDDAIDKSKVFNYTSTGLEHSNATQFEGQSVPPLEDVDVTIVFEDTKTYTIKVIRPPLAGVFTNYTTFIVNYTYYTGADYVTELDTAFKQLDNSLVVTDVAGDTNFNISAPTGVGSLPVVVSIKESNFALGLNSLFTYKGGVVYLDDKGRNLGVSNVTDIFYNGLEYTFSVTTQLTGVLTPPKWATKYMMVRDKVNTALAYYGVVETALSVKLGFTYIKVKNQNYTDYLSDVRGKTVTIYSHSLSKNIDVDVLTLDDMAAETADLSTEYSYFYIKTSATEYIEVGSLVLYQPNKEVESKNEIFYETSDVFNIESGVFKGDGLELNWYDTRVGTIEDDDEYDYIIMKTDSESLRDINHLGRGAYSVINQVEMDWSATLVHSQKYEPSTNYNGLNVFSPVYNNFLDLEKKYGRVVRLHYDDTNLKVGQYRKWHTLLINKELLSTADGSGAIQSSTNFFNRLIPIAGDFGITDKRSFASYGFRNYFLDQENGAMCRESADGISIINAKRDFDIKEILKNHNPIDSIIGGYQVDKEEYVVAFETSGKILRFSEKNKNQVGEYVLPYLPLDYISVDNDFYSISSDDSNLYKENVGSTNEMYGEKVSNTLEFVVNHEPEIIKDFISISTQSNISFDVEVTTTDNKADVVDFIEREGVWYADIKKDSNTSGNSVLGVGTIKSIVDGTNLEFKSPPTNIRVGDMLWIQPIFPDDGQLNIAESVNGNIVTLEGGYSQYPSPDDFVYTIRPSQIEGNSIKGNYAKIKLTNDTYNSFELFGVLTTINLSSHTS